MNTTRQITGDIRAELRAIRAELDKRNYPQTGATLRIPQAPTSALGSPQRGGITLSTLSNAFLMLAGAIAGTMLGRQIDVLHFVIGLVVITLIATFISKEAS